MFLKTFAFFTTMNWFDLFFGGILIITTLLIPVGILVAGIFDLFKNRNFRRTLPRFSIALILYPGLVFFGIACLAMFEMRLREFSNEEPSGIGVKVFLFLFLLAYGFCGWGLIGFVAQKLPFLKDAFNPVEDHLPSIFNYQIICEKFLKVQ